MIMRMMTLTVIRKEKQVIIVLSWTELGGRFVSLHVMQT
jgi:hypothetical protein